MKTGTKQLRFRGDIHHTGTMRIVGPASRRSPSSWPPFRAITKTRTKQVLVHRDSHATNTTCARPLTCFRHPAGRSILFTDTPFAREFRPPKRLITNECQPIPPYSGRGVSPLPIPPSDLRLLASVPRLLPFLHSAFFLLHWLPVVPGRAQSCRGCIPPNFRLFHIRRSAFDVRCSMFIPPSLRPPPVPRSIGFCARPTASISAIL